MGALAGGKLALDHPAEAVARLTISNPEKRNALDHETLGALADALEGLAGREDARCLLIAGAGGVFSAGYDISGLSGEAVTDEAEALVANPFNAAMEAVSAHPDPIVAAIGGPCLGGGLELAVRCDLRVCAAGARLAMPPAKLGLVYGHTGLERFIDVIGVARTKELFLLGRELDAAAAERIGLVSAVVGDGELEAASLRMAREIASHAPLSTRGNKRAIEVLARERPLSAEREAELVDLRRSAFASDDLREGLRAFAEKRRPRWRGR